MRYLCFFFLTFFLILGSGYLSKSIAQISEKIRIEENQRQINFEARIMKPFCKTMDIPDNRRQPTDYERINQRNGARSATWNVEQGYGSSCTNDCVMTAALSCSNSGQSKFRIPLVFTVSNTAGCTPSTVPTQANIDAQLNILNDYFACQNIPVSFYKSVSYPGHPVTGDLSTRFQDLTCTYNENNVTDVPNILNVYVFSNTLYGNGCNGWAYLPYGTTSPNLAVMARTCINGFTYTPGSLNCTTPALGLALVMIHELGHNLGLHHTHNGFENNGNPQGTRTECPDGSNCCTAGDFICDTNADPDLSSTCAIGTGCDKSPNGCPAPCGQSYPSNINTESNIMSYNNQSGCRRDLTTCQRAKIVDALLCARGPQMCDRNINLEFSNGQTGATKEICLGGTAPTFTSMSDCFNWYTGLGASATLLAAGATTFTPSLGAGAGQLNNNVAGTYTWYLGDENEINPNCRTLLTVTVLAETGGATVNGSASFISNQCSTSINANLTTNVNSLPANKLVGWWITQGSPISSTVTNNTTLTAALSGVTIGGTISNPVNHLIKSTSGNPLKNLTLPFDCGPLDEGQNYFATPVLSTFRAAIPDASCSGSQGSLNNITFNTVPGKFRSIPPASIVCLPNPVINPPNYTFSVTISGYTGTANQLGIYILTNGINGSQLFLTFSAAGNGTYNFNQTNFPNYDPGNPGGPLGITVIAWQQLGNGMQNGNISLALNITYPGLPEIPFPSLTSYNNCLFGQFVPLNCSCNCLPQASISSSDTDNVSCPNEMVTLTANPSPNFGYLWSTGSTNMAITVAPPSITLYAVTATHNVVNCSSNASSTVNVEGTTVFSQSDTGYGSLRNIIQCLPPTGGSISFNTAMADTAYLAQPLLIDKNVSISGSGGGVIDLDFNKPGFNMATYGIKINASKVLTLQSLTIQQKNNTLVKPVLLNEGTLIMNNINIKGNVDPVVKNNGVGNIQIQTSSTIKKN